MKRFNDARKCQRNSWKTRESGAKDSNNKNLKLRIY